MIFFPRLLLFLTAGPGFERRIFFFFFFDIALIVHLSSFQWVVDYCTFIDTHPCKYLGLHYRFSMRNFLPFLSNQSSLE